MKHIAVALTCAVLLAHSRTEAQQPRDNQRRAIAGSAAIRGVVAAGNTEETPLRRARVTITGSELDASRTTITDDAGTFAFTGLPPGRYSVSASKDGYVAMGFGASRPGRPGPTFTLAAAQIRQIQVKLPRGAVITGTLRDPQGDPAVGVAIVALSRKFAPEIGERRLDAVPGGSVVTDDRGVYRIYGLSEGTYALRALPRLPPGMPDQLVAVSREDVQRALAEVQEHRTSPRPGMPATSRPLSPASERAAGLSYAHAYYPGTTLESRAAELRLAPGEVRTGIDFDLEYVALARVEGFVTMHAGMETAVILAEMDRDGVPGTATHATPGPDGRFTFSRVPPGHYAVHARAIPSAALSGAIPAESAFWGMTQVLVSGTDVEGLTVPLQPTLTLSGTVLFESRQRSGPNLDGLRLSLRVAGRATSVAALPIVRFEGSRATVRGIAPGPYRFISPVQGIRTRIGGWWLKSVLLDGVELLDAPLTIPSSAKELHATLSDRASELSGVVTGPAGAPVTDAFAVVFSQDARSWFLHSRRIAAVRLNAEGRYVVRNLPEGQYWLAVTSDISSGEWFDPEVLESLKDGAVRVRITGDDRAVQNISVQ